MNEELKKYWGLSFDIGDLVYTRRLVPARPPLRSMVSEMVPGIAIGLEMSPDLINLKIKVLCGDKIFLIDHREVWPFNTMQKILQKNKEHHDQ